MSEPYQLLPPLSADERESLRQSIAALGVLQPVVVDEEGNVLDGHHRAQVAAELGRPCPVQVVTGLSEAEKLETALVLNLGRRHLDADQKRALALELRRRGLSVRWISERTGIPKSTVARQVAGVPNGTPELVTGLDGKQYAAVRLPAFRLPALHDEYEVIRRVIDDFSRWMLESFGVRADLSPDERFKVATNLARRRAARELLRTGQCPDPPVWWVVEQRRQHGEGYEAQQGTVYEWERNTECDAGDFLNWCDAAGITTDRKGGWVFAPTLRYPLGRGRGFDDAAPREAVLGKFYDWLLTPAELRAELTEAKARAAAEAAEAAEATRG